MHMNVKLSHKSQEFCLDFTIFIFTVNSRIANKTTKTAQRTLCLYLYLSLLQWLWEVPEFKLKSCAPFNLHDLWLIFCVRKISGYITNLMGSDIKLCGLRKLRTCSLLNPTEVAELWV